MPDGATHREMRYARRIGIRRNRAANRKPITADHNTLAHSFGLLFREGLTRGQTSEMGDSMTSEQSERLLLGRHLPPAPARQSSPGPTLAGWL
jgi:hypothetical protein